jgi:hypothetical protein
MLLNKQNEKNRMTLRMTAVFNQCPRKSKALRLAYRLKVSGSGA